MGSEATGKGSRHEKMRQVRTAACSEVNAGALGLKGAGTGRVPLPQRAQGGAAFAGDDGQQPCPRRSATREAQQERGRERRDVVYAGIK